MPPGPTRSRCTSARCGRLSSPGPTTATPCCSPGRCMPTCAGATPTPTIPTCWPPNDANEPGCAANATADGASPSTGPRHEPHRRHSPTRRTFVVTALARSEEAEHPWHALALPAPRHLRALLRAADGLRILLGE